MPELRTTAPLALLLAAACALPSSAQLTITPTLECSFCNIHSAPEPTVIKPVKLRSANAVTVVAISLKGLLKSDPADGLGVFVTRLDGFMIDRRRGDVILIGERSAAPPLDDPFDLRDAAEAIRSSAGGQAPYCSLDPIPGNFSGPQNPRVGGVPRDSHFAHVMLDADYLMKSISFGLGGGAGLPSATDRAQNYYAQDCRRAENARSQNRFWFHALEPRSRDVLSSSSGNVFWVKSRLGLRTEGTRSSGSQLVAAAESIDPPSEDFAADFTNRFAAIARSQPLFRRLKGLYQEVYIAGLIRAKADGAPLAVADAWAGRWRGPMDGPPGVYRGLSRTVQFDCDGRQATMTVAGGVEISAPDLEPESDPVLNGLEADVNEAVNAAPDRESWTLEYEMPPSFVEDF
ncbi:MAG: DUF1598 domain-containing protein [Elusimicrobiota bacterium]